MSSAAQMFQGSSLLKIESVPQDTRSNGVLVRLDRETGVQRELTASDLDFIERELKTEFPTFFTAGPKGINCDQGRKNFFAAFITETMGKRLAASAASQEVKFNLEAVLFDIVKRVRDWLGGEDFALVLYQDDWSEQRPLSTPIAFVTWNRSLTDHDELVRAIFNHQTVKEMGILSLPSFVLRGEGQASRLELTPMKAPLDQNSAPRTKLADWRVAVRGLAVPLNVIAIFFNCYIFTRESNDMMLMFSAVLALTALSCYVIGRRA
jgi:hypothetical protein